MPRSGISNRVAVLQLLADRQYDGDGGHHQEHAGDGRGDEDAGIVVGVHQRTAQVGLHRLAQDEAHDHGRQRDIQLAHGIAYQAEEDDGPAVEHPRTKNKSYF